MTGNFSCVSVYFTLKRNTGYYFLHCFIPSLLCVCISWLSFWIKLDIAPARVTFGIATFLTICEQTQMFNSGLPKVSYIKAIDVWMITCDIFVFATLLEYCAAQVNIYILWKPKGKSLKTLSISRMTHNAIFVNSV